MIRQLSNHLFYRIYWWNVRVVKEKDFPLISTLLGVSMFHILNWSTIVFAFGTFVLKDQKFYPGWLHILLMFLILIADYFLFIHNGYYKKLIQEDIITKNETRKLDYLLVLYIILTFVALGYTIFKSREFFA